MLSSETGHVRYCVLTHITITFLSLCFTGFNFIFLLPYMTFMGMCPIAVALFERSRIPRWVSYFLKQLWFTGSTMVTALFGPVFFNIDLVNAQAALTIIAISIPSFFFYDWGMGNIKRKFRLIRNKG